MHCLFWPFEVNQLRAHHDTLPGRVRTHFAGARPQMDAEQFCQDLCLDGLEVSLPSQEEQALKREKALKNLSIYVQACGGALPGDWDCTLRCRITNRRNGRQGLTTDNYYYSPCGKTFRTHKQVAEFLGLQPLLREQIKQQCSAQDTADLPSASYSIVSVSVLESAADSFRSMAAASTQSGKRSHTSMTTTDSAAVCAESQQQQRPAASAPAAAGGTSPRTSSYLHAPAASSQPDSSVLSAPAASHQFAKRTKAALAAKYVASCSNVSSLAGSTATASAAATVGSSGLRSYTSAATQAMSMQLSCGSADASAQPSPACASAAAAVQEGADPFLQFSPAQPAVSTNASSKGSRSGSSSKAVSSRLVVALAAVQPLQQCSAQQQKQQRPAVVQPVPKPWKPRQQPAWKLQLRALATQGAIAGGLLPGPSTTSASP